MINDYAIAESMLDKFRAFCAVNIYEYNVDGVSSNREPDESYLSESLLFNAVDSVGLESTSSDITRPIYQINVYTPKNQGKWAGLNIIAKIRDEFKKASFVPTVTGQKIQISSVDATQLKGSSTSSIREINAIYKTHYVYAVSVNLTVIASNT